MATMRDIRRRIKTVRNIQQITQALKMVAAARLQRAQSRLHAAGPYADEMFTIMSQLVTPERIGETALHPLLEPREPANIGIILITSDRGMAGSYNTNAIRRAMNLVEPHERDCVKLLTVGRKGQRFFARRQYNIAAEFPMPPSEVSFAEARQVGRTARQLFENREVDIVRLVYTRFYSAMRQRVVDMQLLPVETPAEEEPRREDYIFEPEVGVLLGRLLPRYVDTQIYRAMLESLASEHSARTTAMGSATDNAQEMIENLTLQFNRARQSAITKELADIVGGAEALK